jgi:hypothetical protein
MGKTGKRSLALAALVSAGAIALQACGSVKSEAVYPESTPGDERAPPRKSNDPERETVFGPGGLDIFGSGSGRASGGGGGPGLGINSYLWRASLDTISFMPLSSADPFGGVIITDWYAPPEAPDERFKMNVYILGRELRADGLRVAVFRQNRTSDGRWSDVPVAVETGTNLENQILTRARQLRVASASR